MGLWQLTDDPLKSHPLQGCRHDFPDNWAQIIIMYFDFFFFFFFSGLC